MSLNTGDVHTTGNIEATGNVGAVNINASNIYTVTASIDTLAAEDTAFSNVNVVNKIGSLQIGTASIDTLAAEDVNVVGNLSATEITVSGNIEADSGYIETLGVQDLAAIDVSVTGGIGAIDICGQTISATEAIAAKQVYVTDGTTDYTLNLNESKLVIQKGNIDLLELSED